MFSKSDNDLDARTVTQRPNLSRRTFLIAGAAVGAVAMTGTVAFMQPAFGVADAQTAAFMRVSSFVTGRNTLNATTGQRFFAALAKRDADFAAQVGALLAYIDSAKLTSMDAMLAVPDVDKALMATATTIVSAWYLGIVGKPADAELITYADSLMYEPTRGILAVPTYGPGPLAWGPKPVAMTTTVGASASVAGTQVKA